MQNFLKEMRIRAGLSAEELAEKVGTSRQQIYRLESGARKISPTWAVRLAAALNVSPSDIQWGSNTPHPTSDEDVAKEDREVLRLLVSGEVATGVWREVSKKHTPEYRVAVLKDERFPSTAYFALRAAGSSSNMWANENDVFICIDFGKAGILPRDRDYVIVERQSADHKLIELSARVLFEEESTQIFQSMSLDDQYQDEIVVRRDDKVGQVTRILGLIVGVYRYYEFTRPSSLRK